MSALADTVQQRINSKASEIQQQTAPLANGAVETVVALQLDVAGRMTKALQGEERFNRWGKHYLRATIRAHQLQTCTNCMDEGLQKYGGALFTSLKEEGDKIFISLPAPAPK